MSRPHKGYFEGISSVSWNLLTITSTSGTDFCV